MRRILVIDSLRGIAILFMLLFHSSYYWDVDLTVTEYNQLLNHPLGGFAFFLGKFAGIFAVISGMANAISIHIKAERGDKPQSIFSYTFIAGLWIIIIGKIHTIFFNHSLTGDLRRPFPIGPKYHSILVGWIKFGTIKQPNLYSMLFRNTALFVIGISIIVTGTLFAILFRNDGHQKVGRNFLIMGFIGTMFIVFSQPMKNWLRPIWVDAVISQQNVKGFLLGLAIGDSYPIFPFAGYAIYGALFGMAFYYEIPTRKVNFVGITISAFYFVFGSIFLSIRGLPDITSTFETPDIQLNFLQIGFLILISTALYNVHYFPDGNTVKKIIESKFIRRFGLLTLTVFIMEALVGISIKVYILDRLFPEWSNTILFASVFGISLIFLWSLIFIVWERIDFIGSWEWINARVISYITGRRATRLRIKEHLHGVAGK